MSSMFFADESTGTGSSEFEEALTEAKEEPSGEDEEESSEETTEEGEEKSSFEEAFANALSDAKTKVDNANKEAKEAEQARKKEETKRRTARKEALEKAAEEAKKAEETTEKSTDQESEETDEESSEETTEESTDQESEETDEESSEETAEEGEKKPSFEEAFADALTEAKKDVDLANEQMKKEAEDAKKTEEPAEELTGEESTETAEEPIDEATERANAKIAADKAFWDNQKKRLAVDDARGSWSSSNDNVVDYIKKDRRSKKLSLPALSVSGMKNYDDITAACNFIVTLGIYTFGFQSVSGLDIRKEFKTYNEGGVNDHSILCGSPNYNTYELSFKRGLLLRTSAMMGSMVALAAVLATSVVVPSNIARRTAAFAVGSTIDPQTVLENGPTLGTIQVFDRNRTRLQGLFSFVSLGMKSWRADDLDATSGSIWYEDITIAHTGLTRHPVDILPWGNVSAQGTNDSAYSARNQELYDKALGRIPHQVQAKVYSYQEARSAIEARRTQQLGELAEAENRRKQLQIELENAQKEMASKLKTSTFSKEDAEKLTSEQQTKAQAIKDRQKTSDFTKIDEKLADHAGKASRNIPKQSETVTTTAEENKAKSKELTVKQKDIDDALKSKLKTTTELDNIKASEELTSEQQTKAQAIKDRQKTSDFSEIDEDLKTRATAAQKIVPKQAEKVTSDFSEIDEDLKTRATAAQKIVPKQAGKVTSDFSEIDEDLKTRAEAAQKIVPKQAGKVTSDFSKVDKELADRAKKASGNVPKQSATVTTEHKKGDATPVDADLKAKGDKAKDKLKKDDNK